MQTSKPDFKANEGHLGGVILVIAAGVLWSTVGIGIRLIEDASVWQILFFRCCQTNLTGKRLILNAG